MLHAAETRLREDYQKADNLEVFEQLREFLPLGDNATPYAEAAKRLSIKEATLRLQIHRMRKRYEITINWPAPWRDLPSTPDPAPKTKPVPEVGE